MAKAKEISAEQLAGLENGVEFQAMLVAATGKPERSMGNAIIPAEPPAWKDVKRHAESLLSIPPHLAVLVNLVKADTHLRGFSGLAEALQLLADLLGSHWSTAYPPPDEDDPDDPYYARVNLMRELSDDRAFVDQMARIPLVQTRGIGAFSARDIDISRGRIDGTEEEKARCQDGLIRGTFESVGAEALTQTSSALEQALNLCMQLEALFAEQSGQPDLISLNGLHASLKRVQGVFQEYAEDYIEVQSTAIPEEPAGPITDGRDTTVASESAERSVAPEGRLQNRNDVTLALEQIIRYYQLYEPASPVPIFASRARDLIPLGFFELLQQLAPGQPDSLTSALQGLSGDPVQHIMDDGYQRFLAGERIDVVSAAGESAFHDAADAVPSDSASTTTGPTSAPVGIDNREAVQRTLAEIDQYFARHEPSSPIPLLTAEIRKLVARRFTELLAEFGRTRLGSETGG